MKNDNLNETDVENAGKVGKLEGRLDLIELMVTNHLPHAIESVDKKVSKIVWLIISIAGTTILTLIGVMITILKLLF